MSSLQSPRFTRIGRWTGAALLTATAANHARLAAMGAGDVARHELFVGLNLGLALLLVLRPRWALAPGAVDWASAGVLVFFPVLLTLLVVERRTAGTRESPRATRRGS